MSRALALLVVVSSLPVSLQAQTIDDGIMLTKHAVFAGGIYSHERWDEYWEGPLKRVNGNIGTITTQTNNWFGNYGLTDRLNVMATVPRVWTDPSQGVLRGQSGFQDMTVAGKYSFIEKGSPRLGVVRAIAVGTAAFPLTDYTPDFYPLSLGSASRRFSGRLTANAQKNPGWYINGSAAYTWRGDVTLDRPYYYTDGQLFFTDQVDMPNVFDYVASGGYLRGGLMATVSFSQQRTLGGGDIRRQDMPFVSNRMNFSKVGGMVKAPVPKLRGIAGQFGYAYTLDGRNVGQATTFMGGLLYSFPSHRRAVQ